MLGPLTLKCGRAVPQGTFADVVEIIVAVLLPPLGVFLATGLSSTLLINILLVR